MIRPNGDILLYDDSLWDELIKTNDFVEQLDEDHYIVREFKRTETDWRFFYVNKGNYPLEKVSVYSTNDFGFDIDDIYTAPYLEYIVVRPKRQKALKFKKYGDMYYVSGIGENDWTEVKYTCDVSDVEKYFKVAEKTIIGWKLEKWLTDLILDKLWQR